MRWFVGCAVALLVMWGVYVVSPYWALRQIAAAVEAEDVAELGRRVNLRALRHSLIRQVAADISANDRSGTASARDTQLAIGAITAAVEPLIDQLLTSRGLVDLLRPPAPASEAAPGREGGPFSADRNDSSLARLWDFLAASSWRGFRNVYFTLPPNAARDDRYRLQLRLGRLRWRLVGVDLPTDMRRRFARSVAELHAPRDRPDQR